MGPVYTLHVCSREPASHEGIAAVELGRAVTRVDPRGDLGPHAVTVAGVSGLAILVAGRATHWALSRSGGLLVAWGLLPVAQDVGPGHTCDLSEFDIFIVGGDQ